MPGLDGIDFVKKINVLPEFPVSIVFTAYGSVETAVEAMKAGAYDYLTKPVNLDNLEIVLQRGLESRQLKKENQLTNESSLASHVFQNMIGVSQEIQEIFTIIKQVAPVRSTVLITGESGTGKELVARAIHRLSPRCQKPFITVHCAALTRTLLESELFGHEKHSFTGAAERRIGRFEAADRGTIFLDEIGEIDPSIQVALLRILETQTFERVGGTESIGVDVRLIAATNRDLKSMVENGTFREDLYYRLDVLNIHMPALCQRQDDIPILLNHYLTFFNRENDRKINGFTPEALEIMLHYRWPGNIRELRNVVERNVVLTQEDWIDSKHLPKSIRDAVAGGLSGTVENRTIQDQQLDLDSNEKRLIAKALRECRGNRSAAALKLGISRRTIIRKIKQYELTDL
jgi:DNA-binding NtrC family response regulator